MKFLKFAALALLLSAGFTACSDDDPAVGPSPNPDPVIPTRGEGGFYVVNQGNMGVLDGTLDFFSADGQTRTAGIFQSANNQSVGDSPQKPVIYGSKLYIPVYSANLVWVINTTTSKIEASIKTTQPEAVCGAEGYLFVANNDGNVTRVDTTDFSKTATLAVGPNPAGLTTTNGKVYVSISDGYNYANGYVDGFKVAEVDAKTFTKTRDIKVGMNPGDITSDNYGNVFVVCRGDYGATVSTIYKFTPANSSEASAFCPGTLIATNNQQRTSRATDATPHDQLIVLNAVSDYSDWPNVKTVVTSALYNSVTGEKLTDSFLASDELPLSPTTVDINPTTHEVYVCSDATMGADQYTTPGYIKVYSATGTYLRTLTTGVHPFGVAFK